MVGPTAYFLFISLSNLSRKWRWSNSQIENEDDQIHNSDCSLAYFFPLMLPCNYIFYEIRDLELSTTEVTKLIYF